MRIALVAPLVDPIPPPAYGGTERVLHNLVHGLVVEGHDVTLYSVGTSSLTPAPLALAQARLGSARLIPVIPTGFREQGYLFDDPETIPVYLEQLRRVFEDVETERFQIVHVHHYLRLWHVEFFEEWGRRRKIKGPCGCDPPVILTDHGLFNPTWMEKAPIFTALDAAGIRFTAISRSQSSHAPKLTRPIPTVYNGIAEDLLYPIGATPSYLAFLGRFTPMKGAETAVRIAMAAEVHLKVAGPSDEYHTEHTYTDNVLSQMAVHGFEYIGEINDAQKSPFLSGAVALLFPITWEEPFGLVVIEAMACGTPVIAFRRGAMTELVEDGVTGFVVGTEEEAVQKVRLASDLDRGRIRREFERRFTAGRMAKAYVRAYEEVYKEMEAETIYKRAVMSEAAT